MRVGIDLTALLPLATGWTTLRLVGGLGRVDGETAYTLFVNTARRALSRREE